MFHSVLWDTWFVQVWVPSGWINTVLHKILGDVLWSCLSKKPEYTVSFCEQVNGFPSQSPTSHCPGSIKTSQETSCTTWASWPKWLQTETWQLINRKFIIPIPKPHLQLLDFQSVKNIFSLWRKKPKQYNIGILKPTLNKTWKFWLYSQISLLVYEILVQTLFKPKEKLYISKIWKKCRKKKKEKIVIRGRSEASVPFLFSPFHSMPLIWILPDPCFTPR